MDQVSVKMWGSTVNNLLLLSWNEFPFIRSRATGWCVLTSVLCCWFNPNLYFIINNHVYCVFCQWNGWIESGWFVFVHSGNDNTETHNGCMCVCVCLYFRFFVMYLINKDETEHTGQVKQLISLCHQCGAVMWLVASSRGFRSLLLASLKPQYASTTLLVLWQHLKPF